MSAVSIIIPCYNSEKYIAECLDSALAQTFADFEIIAVDDGSTDASAELLAEYATKDNRLHIITQKNAGLSAARNSGLDNAKGEYICFVDADDLIHPNYLQTMFDAITREKADFVHIEFRAFSQISDISTTLPVAKPPSVIFNPLQDLLPCKKDIFFTAWSFMYRKTTIADLRFVKGLFMCEDIIFNAAFLEKAKKGILLDLPLYYYRYNPNSLLHTKTSPSKALSYLKGAEILYNQSKGSPDFLRQIQATRINQELKNALKQMQKLDDKSPVAKKIKKLYKAKIINLKGLSLSKKLALLKILISHA